MRNKVMKDQERYETQSSNFLVNIYRQENHSWQGVIQWLDTGKKIHFRSQLEMIMLMQEALTEKGVNKEGIRSWKENEGIDAIG
ncbi:MAG: hypothetical protein JW708_12540 [Vallitaleaceae bacterium]|nr:hypothetical protein [Vallitaleaceae bacterium]